MPANRCCAKAVPSAVMHNEGDEWTCPTCASTWVMEVEESEGAAWWPKA